MSGRRTVGGLLGTLSDRLLGRARGQDGMAGEPPAAAPEANTAQRLDDALAGLRKRIPESGHEDAEPPASD